MSTLRGFRPPKLGVGMTFSSALLSYLQRRPEALDFVELEPQTLWLADDAINGPFFEYAPALALLEGIEQRVLVHSVGVPLGGRRKPSPSQMALLNATAKKLNSPWVSEHLSVGGTPHCSSGFFLPPLQTDEGVVTATNNIRRFAKGIDRPVAIETGVSYFKRKPFEMPDGEFVAQIAEAADCGILLDLHNLYCNEKNGRCDISSFMTEIPLDRVWEVHLAGGELRDGIWLDSHCGSMPDDLFRASKEISAHCPT